MALKEPKSMTEIHAIRNKIEEETKVMSMHEKFAWISSEAKKSKVVLKIYISPLKAFKKAS